MLAFITTLRHPQNSVDYARVEKLLLDTLKSVGQQTSDDHVIIVVGNKRPDFELPDKVYFVPVAFPAPAPPTGAKTAREPFVWDKGTKLGVGLIKAREYSPSHVMIFDADDFVHRDIAATVQGDRSHSAWVVRNGWMYSRQRNVYVGIPDFNRRCGTCYVVPFDVYGVPEDLTVSATQEQIAAGYGDRLNSIMGAHREAEDWFKVHGVTMTEFPYRAAVYHVDTGENHSGKTFSGWARPFNSRLRRDFGIHPSRGRIGTLWAAHGPAVLSFEGRRLLGRFKKRLSKLRGASRRAAR
jgi:hypothetical protein